MIRNFKILLSFIVFVVIFSGCAAKKSNRLKISEFRSDEICLWAYDDTMDPVLDLIDEFVGTRAGGDCSGLVKLINKRHDNIYFDESKIYKHMSSSRYSEGIYNYYKSGGNIAFDNPRAGDLIFFYNTTSNTRNSKRKLITHIGVIRDVYSDGRVSFIHNSRGKNRVDYMNLNSKNTHRVGARIENSYILRCSSGNKSCLTSNRFAGFGRVVR